jgi:release factor glutamine methyltransferase
VRVDAARSSEAGPGADWVAPDGPSIRMALAVATADLREAGVDNPRLDAELLLADALRKTRTSLHLHPERIVDAAACERFAQAVARRRAREPVAYIRGTRGFRHIDLHVDNRVLVPRPETELLVEVALRLPRGARVADVGTGSGAVALALKHERPDLRVIATDLSADALEVARANAAALRLDVAFAHGDLLDAVDGPLDAVPPTRRMFPTATATASSPRSPSTSRRRRCSPAATASTSSAASSPRPLPAPRSSRSRSAPAKPPRSPSCCAPPA